MDDTSTSATPATLAERLAHCRALVDEPKLSARELDRIAGLHHGHTSAIESGERTNPERETVRKLAGALGVRVGWLLEGEGDAPPEDSVCEAVTRARDEYAAKNPGKNAAA